MQLFKRRHFGTDAYSSMQRIINERKTQIPDNCCFEIDKMASACCGSRKFIKSVRKILAEERKAKTCTE